MRGLVIVVVILSGLLVAGAGAVAAKLLSRTPGHGVPAQAPVAALSVLNEPPGSRIVGVAAVADGVAVVVQGGGADRVLIVAGGREIGRISLAHTDPASQSLTPPGAGR